MKVWNSEDAEDEVLAMVVRVKLDTTMGSMVRQLIAPVSAMQKKVSFETVSGLYLLEYTLTCRKCQGALFSAMQQKMSFEIMSGVYLLLKHIHVVDVKMLQSHPCKQRSSVCQHAKMHLCPPYKRRSHCMP